MKQSTVILLTLSVAAVLWVAQNNRLQQERRLLRQWHLEQATLQNRIDTVEEALTESTRQRRQIQRERDAVRAQTVTVEATLAEEDPEHYWVEPPPVWPSWNSASPYVWLRKKDLGSLRAPVFTDAGFVRPEVAGVLVLDPHNVRTVNGLLPALLDQHRALEWAHAERVEERLPGIADDGPYVTIRVRPFAEEALRLREQFEAVLREQFGEQRADILLESGARWMNQHFHTSESEPVSYSAVRHPDGTFNVSINRPRGSMSAGGAIDLKSYFPEHLVPLFEELQAPAPIEQAQQTP